MGQLRRLASARGSSYHTWGAEYDVTTDTWLTPALVSDAGAT
jgi:hypothetical protein